MFDVKALWDEVLCLVRESQAAGPDQVALADLPVCGVGNVPAQHVVEQDTQWPDCQTGGPVLSLQDPLWWAVDSGASELLEYSVWLILVIVLTPGPEVNQLGVEGVQVHEDVLVLDVPVQDPAVSAVDHSLNNITEHFAGKSFRQRPLLGYKIKKVLAINSLHNNVIAVRVINVVQDPDHTGDILYLLHESDFCRNVCLDFIIILISSVFYHFFNCHLEAVTEPHSTEYSAEASLAQHLPQFILRL